MWDITSHRLTAGGRDGSCLAGSGIGSHIVHHRSVSGGNIAGELLTDIRSQVHGTVLLNGDANYTQPFCTWSGSMSTAENLNIHNLTGKDTSHVSLFQSNPLYNIWSPFYLCWYSVVIKTYSTNPNPNLTVY